MKLSQWAKEQGLSYQTAWNWIKAKTFPVPYQQLETGTILVFPENKQELKTYIYCRVSSSNKKEDLQRQKERCIEFCNSRGYVIEKVIAEISSGMNDNRKKLLSLFSLPAKRIIVEHKDRLTRFGFNYMEIFLNQLGFELIIINRDYEEENELVRDLISIITSFCCRLYGLRKGINKSKRIKQVLNEDNN